MIARARQIPAPEAAREPHALRIPTAPGAPSQPRLRHAACHLAGVLFGCLAFGCGIFDTRTPQEPEGPSVPFVTPVDRESVVLTNMEVSFEAKQVTNYDRSLYDDDENTFYYLPPPAEEADFLATFPGGYSRSDEINVTTANLGAPGTLSVTWGIPAEPVPGDEEGVTVIQNLSYEFVFTDGEQTKTYSGACNLLFREGDIDGFQLSGIEDLGGTADNWTRLKLRRADVFAGAGSP